MGSPCIYQSYAKKLANETRIIKNHYSLKTVVSFLGICDVTVNMQTRQSDKLCCSMQTTTYTRIAINDVSHFISA